MNEYKKSVRQKLAEKLDLPGDVTANQPRITVCGYHEAIIYNHKGITEYGDERISIATAKATVKITGLKLTVKAMSSDSISVVGQLMGIEFSY